jgi:glycosyltransferase involved in cell wall biosynthesis
MTQLKICYIQRPDYQIQLSGPYIKRQSYFKMLDALSILTVIKLEETNYKASSSVKPDLLDLTYYQQVLDLHLEQYDLVFNERYTLLPILDQIGVRHIFLPHMTWECNDGFAHDLEKYAPFSDIVICETPLIKGMFIRFTKHCFVLPNPNTVKEFRYNHTISDVNDNIIMVGRDDDVKQMYLGIDAFNLAKLPCRLDIYSSIPLCKKTESKINPNTTRVHIAKPTNYERSSILLHTSTHETACIAIQEAISNGLTLVIPTDFGYDHYVENEYTFKFARSQSYSRQVKLIIDMLKYAHIMQTTDKSAQLQFHKQHTLDIICGRLKNILDQITIITQETKRANDDYQTDLKLTQLIYRQLKEDTQKTEN